MKACISVLLVMLGVLVIAGCGSTHHVAKVYECTGSQQAEHPLACEQAAARVKQQERQENREDPNSDSAQFELFKKTQARAKQNLRTGETYVTTEDEQRAQEEVEAERASE